MPAAHSLATEAVQILDEFTMSQLVLLLRLGDGRDATFRFFVPLSPFPSRRWRAGWANRATADFGSVMHRRRSLNEPRPPTSVARRSATTNGPWTRTRVSRQGGFEGRTLFVVDDEIGALTAVGWVFAD